MMRCKCGSYAVNPNHHGRKSGVDEDKCDVCYWRTRAEDLASFLQKLRKQAIRDLGSDVVQAYSKLNKMVEEKLKEIDFE